MPPDTDIRDLDGFMLNTERLMASELWALSTGEEFKAALGLWCRAWKQTPPGSLPDDDRVLAAFSGAGARWKKLKAMALRGFIKCADGRLYHKTLCDDVMRAAAKKAGRHERTRVANSRWGDRTEVDGDRAERRSQRLSEARKRGRHTPEEWEALLQVFGRRCLKCGATSSIVKDHITPIYQGGSDSIDNLQPLCNACNGRKGSDTTDHRTPINDWRERLANALSLGVKTPAKRLQNATTGQGRDSKDSGTDVPAAVAAPDPAETVWKTGTQLITAGGLSEASARSFLGALVKAHGETAVAEKIAAFALNPKADPRGWLKGALNGTHRNGGPASAVDRVKAAAAAREAADPNY